MSGFVVDSRTLVAVRDTLGRLNDQLLGMHTVIWHRWGTLGGHTLESELEHFCGTWHYGVTELGGQLQDLTRRLGEAAAAYERIEERITKAGGGSGSGSTSGGGAVSPTGSGHTTASTHHTAAKHAEDKHHTAKHTNDKHHANANANANANAPGGKHYSGGAAVGPAPTGSGGTRGSGDKHSGRSGDKHSGGEDHSGVGSGTTVIGGSPGHDGGSHHGGSPHGGSSGSGAGTTVIGGGPTKSSGSDNGGSHRGGDKHHPGSGTGVTVIGGGPTQTTSSGGGTGTTTVDEKIHHAEDRQRAELAAVLKMVEN
jgi:hypothetical protein